MKKVANPPGARRTRPCAMPSGGNGSLGISVCSAASAAVNDAVDASPTAVVTPDPLSNRSAFASRTRAPLIDNASAGSSADHERALHTGADVVLAQER